MVTTTKGRLVLSDTSTRVRHPGRRRPIYLAFLALIFFNVMVFGVAFLNYGRKSGEGCICRSLSLSSSNSVGISSASGSQSSSQSSPQPVPQQAPLSIPQVSAAEEQGVIVLHPIQYGAAVGLIQEGDVLLAVDGTPIPVGASVEEASALIARQPTGAPILLTVRTADQPGREVHLVRENTNWLIHWAMLLGASFPLAYSLIMLIDLVTFGVALALVGLIAWRRSDDWMALFIAVGVIASMIQFSFSFGWLNTAIPWLYLMFTTFGEGIALGTGAAFPDGRFRPNGTRALLVVALVLLALSKVVLPMNSTLRPGGVLAVVAVFSGMFIYRYRHLMTPLQRQQTKWAALGSTVAFLSKNLFSVIRITVDNNHALNDAHVWLLFAAPVVALLTMALPLGIAFAMLRYRLYDVDLAINQGLVNTVMTASLGGIFVVIFLLAQTMLGGILGPAQSSIAIAISAAATGVLFNPARRRVQHFIDHRFYKFRFDLIQLKERQRKPEIKTPGLLTGRTLGRYQVLGLLGRGAMGEVYQAECDDELIALKILPIDLGNHEEFRKRFTREAQALSSLNHPNIVKLIESGEIDGITYLAMEYIDGKELGELMKERGFVQVEEVLPFIEDVASALDHAHQQGLVHRDIKPSNIMLREVNGKTQAVLMDFGIAKLQNSITALTGTSFVGTINYMAPEQIQSAIEVDRRADIYAMGVVLYELFTGVCPFEGTPGQVLFAHIQQPVPDPRKIKDTIPPRVSAAILKALSKDPNDRFQTAGAFAAAILAGV